MYHAGTVSPAHNASVAWRARITVQRAPSTITAGASGRAL